jgi:hypothetical protein
MHGTVVDYYRVNRNSSGIPIAETLIEDILAGRL